MSPAKRRKRQKKRPAPKNVVTSPKQRPVFLKNVGKLVLWTISLLGIILMSAWFAKSWWQGHFKRSLDSQVIVVASTRPDAAHPLIILKVTDGEVPPQVLLIDPEAEVELLGGYGLYPIRSLVPVLLADGRSKPFVASALSLALGRVVDQVWLVSDQTWPVTEVSLNQTLETDDSLSWLEWQSWKWWLGQWPLESETITSLPLNEAVTSQWQPELFRQCPLAIVNTTAVGGLGTRLGNLLEKSGVFVIRVTDTSLAEPSTRVVLNDPAAEGCQPVVAILEKMVTEPLQTTGDKNQAAHYRAEAVVLVGEDLAELFANF